MSESSIDVLMKVVGPSGAYAAESNTTFVGTAVSDPLRSGFTPGQFCELQSFSFSAGAESALKSDEAKERDEEEKKKKAKDSAKPEGSAFGGGLTYREKMESIYKGQGDRRDARERDDEVDMQPVTFTRMMDSMSTLLFTALSGCETLDSLTVVKRRAAGTGGSGACYLRLDFTSVLITELEWEDNQHFVLETGTFIYRKLKMLYRPQKPDGTLDVAIQAEWEMKLPK